jgi:hypothetical protein
MLKKLSVTFRYDGKDREVLLLVKSMLHSYRSEEEQLIRDSECTLCGDRFDNSDTLIRDPESLGGYVHVACIRDDNSRGSD